jgi:excisionase family DNA binding protein
MESIMTLQQAAELLQTTDRYLSDNIKAGKLKAYKMGKRIYIINTELIGFIIQHPYKGK